MEAIVKLKIHISLINDHTLVNIDQWKLYLIIRVNLSQLEHFL